MQIWKFPLEANNNQTVAMPQGATILCAQVQDGTVCLWAEVDPAQQKIGRLIQIFGTGQDYEQANRRYIGSVQLFGGGLVFHVFELL